MANTMMEGFGSYWIANIVNAGLEDKVGVCAVPEGPAGFLTAIPCLFMLEASIRIWQ